MKKMLFLLLAVMSAATMFAAEPASEPTITEANYLWRDGCKIYQGENLLTKQEYKNLLQNTCPEAFAQYKKGTVIANWGWGLLGAGAAIAVGIGVPLWFLAPAERPHIALPAPLPDNPTQEEIDAYNQREQMFWEMQHAIERRYHNIYSASIAMMSIGGVMAVGSVPVICIGYSKRHKSLTTYNQQCVRQEPAITYSLTVGQNGLGLAVQF